MMTAESYLLDHGGWLNAKTLASLCGVNERSLRGEDSPIRECAISGNDGYIHIQCATEAEVQHYINRLRKHGIEELKHAQTVKRIRRSRGPLKQSELFAA